MREYDWDHREIEVVKEVEIKWHVHGFGRKPKTFDSFLHACEEYTYQKETYNVAKLVRVASTVTREVEKLPRWNHNYGNA